jgi:hypothetical protein
MVDVDFACDAVVDLDCFGIGSPLRTGQFSSALGCENYRAHNLEHHQQLAYRVGSVGHVGRNRSNPTRCLRFMFREQRTGTPVAKLATLDSS